MKTLRFSFLALVVMAFGFASCDRGADEPTPGISLTLNGTAWTAKTFKAEKINGRVEISAVGTDTSDLLIILPADTVRSYELSDKTIVLAFRPKGGNWHTSQLVENVAGSNVIITESDTTSLEITGTFSGSVQQAIPGTPSATITGGKFTVLKVNPVAAPAVVDAMSFAVDGVQLAPAATTSNNTGIATVLGTVNAAQSLSVNINQTKTGVGVFEATGQVVSVYQEGTDFFQAVGGQIAILRNDPIAKHMTVLFHTPANNLFVVGNKEITNGFANFSY